MAGTLGDRRNLAERPNSEESRSAPTSGGANVPVITSERVDVGEAELAGRERDSLVLTAEERRWGRRRVTTTGGRTLALALPTGSTLALGEVLHVGPDWYVVVEGACEPVLALTPASREEALRIAFEVGNRHFTLALDGERILVPDDPAMQHLLARLGVGFQRVRAVFVPIGAGHRHEA
jgi:urease accessory protein